MSAPVTMLRNLYIVNGLPPRPMRSWWKSAGPGLSRRTRTAMVTSAGESSSSPSAAAVRSITFLTIRRGPVNRGASMCSNGSPAIGRVSTRGPATSVRPGATTSSMSRPSNAQPSSRSPRAPSCQDDVQATVSTPMRAATAAASRSLPTIGTPSMLAMLPSPQQAATTL